MSSFNLANKITIIRLFFVPVIIVISAATKLQSEIYNYIYLALIVLFGIGDVVDGYIARKYAQITTLGSFLDPFADKYMVISCLIVLTYYGKIPLWYMILVFHKDLFVFIAWTVLFIVTKEVYVKPNILCKASTVFHILIIFMAYLGLDSKMMIYVIIISSIVTLSAGISYIIDGLQYYKNTKGQGNIF